jgi:peptide/nickel transport system substrate-binding protein
LVINWVNFKKNNEEKGTMMFSKKTLLLLMVIALLSVIAAQCGAAPTPETVVQTVVVPQTVVVEKEGEMVVETVEVVKEVVVTPTPEEEMAEELPAVSPQFKDADTYMVITGAGEPETLDPAWTYETAGSAVENNIYEALVWFDRERTDAFVPALATDWEVNDTGDVWTFNVREGVTFHKGGTLEPHDVAYSLQRALLQDRIDGPHWMTLEAFFGLFSIEDLAIKNYAEAQGIDEESDAYAELTFDQVDEAALTQTCEMVKGAVVADDEAGTVTYNLNRATPWFLAMMANSFMGAVGDMEWMVENGAWDGDCATWVQYHDPSAEDTILFSEANGTGPYMLAARPASSAWSSGTSRSGAPAWLCWRLVTPTISMSRRRSARNWSRISQPCATPTIPARRPTLRVTSRSTVICPGRS